MVTVLAALDEGIITPDDTFFCPGHLDVSNQRFHCWKSGGHGEVDLITSLKESCDVYYYELALQIGIERIADMARLLGLGEKHAVPMSAVSSGLVPDKDWKFANRGANWLIGDTVVAAIGQGYVSASPLQLAVMTARLASGLALEPQLIRAENGQTALRTNFPELNIDSKHLKIVRDAMFSVTNDRKGTAYSSRIIADKARMAGKTGTSQVRNISEAERRSGVIKNEDLPWGRRDHALFVNFAPADDPEIAVCVVVEHGGGGSAAAAPIARDITLQALYRGDPPLDAYPPKDREQIAQQQRAIREKMPDLSALRKARV
jgi:penicillin-binding protein 2